MLLKLDGKIPKDSKHKLSKTKNTSSELKCLNLDDLRDMPQLVNQAEKHLRFLSGVDSFSDMSESESIPESDKSISPEPVKSKKSSRKLKSGLVAKITDRVRFPQIYPHVALQYDYATKSIEFKDLYLSLTVCSWRDGNYLQ